MNAIYLVDDGRIRRRDLFGEVEMNWTEPHGGIISEAVHRLHLHLFLLHQYFYNISLEVSQVWLSMFLKQAMLSRGWTTAR